MMGEPLALLEPPLMKKESVAQLPTAPPPLLVLAAPDTIVALMGSAIT